MAAASLCTYSLPDLAFLRPDSTLRLRVSLSRISLSRGKKSALSFRARVQREEFVVEERERESVSEASSVELNGNGNGNGSVYGHNGAVEKYTNGSVGVIESENGAINGSLVKYVNGNGSASRIAEEVVESEAEEVGRKKTIEEIGQEEAWFKQSEQEKLEVQKLVLWISPPLVVLIYWLFLF